MSYTSLIRLLLLISISKIFVVSSATPAYLIGSGVADITGPAADINMLGYADPAQTVAGIHTRLYAKAFIFVDPKEPKNPSSRCVLVNLDAHGVGQALSQDVFRQLQAKYGGLYSDQNVLLSATHTHSGPGGFYEYMLYSITSLGFVRQTYDAMLRGTMAAIAQAHDNLAPADAFIAQGDLLEASINRSPTAYDNNPPEERAQYKYNTDKTMTLVKFQDAQGRAFGSINWFAVHPTSVNQKNLLINGDNKGLASQLMEKWAVQQGGSFAPNYIAAFGQGNHGDVTPNTQGAFCIDSGQPCDMATSTCKGNAQLCMGRGPGYPDDKISALITAQKQADKAQELHQAVAEQLAGPIQSGHMYINMAKTKVTGTKATRAGDTCPAAMGYSFAAGTTDGPGAFGFRQGDTQGGPLWNAVRNIIKDPSQNLTNCQKPKPILLATGEITVPYKWQPDIVDISIMRVGQLVLLGVPGELTTMAGRRLRAAVVSRVSAAWGNDVKVVIAGISNGYSSYITTYEEYMVQRYEGASTIFGPYTLDAYIQEFGILADALVAGKAPPTRPAPPNLIPEQWSLVPGVILDGVPFGSSFGAVVRDVKRGSAYKAGDVVEVVFRSACPRNDLRTGDTFLTVERQDSKTGVWKKVYTDNDWSTTFYWSRPFRLSAESTATIQWTIPSGTPAGTYRIQHFGTRKGLFGNLKDFSGTSSTFQIIDNASGAVGRRLMGMTL